MPTFNRRGSSQFEVSPSGTAVYPIRIRYIYKLKDSALKQLLNDLRGAITSESRKGAKANKGICRSRVMDYKGIVLYAADVFERKRYMEWLNRTQLAHPEIEISKGKKVCKDIVRQWCYLKPAARG